MARGPKRTHAQDHVVKGRRLERHIHELGLASEDEYRTWCLDHGFSKDLHKSNAQRQKEQDLATQLRGEAALSKKRRGTRHPQNTITSLHQGELLNEDLGAEYLENIRTQFNNLGDDAKTRQSFHDLLVHVQRYGALFGLEPAIPFLGPAPGNCYVDGMAMLARNRAAWIRPISKWRPNSHNPRRQFNHLARHLLATYDVPFLMDAAWFQEEAEIAREQQGWFCHIGNGQNIRSADIPVKLTKMMSHCFSNAPEALPIERALRWGQIVGQGGSPSLARAVMSSRLGMKFGNEDFWETVLKFLVNNPMIDPTLVGPIVDFVHNVKFAPREIVHPGGQVQRIGPAQPNFAVKGRSAEKLLGQMEEWHEQLGQDFAADEDIGRGRKAAIKWDASGLRPLQIQEENPQTGETIIWMVQELTSSKELVSEGRAMRHCVSSYAKNCRKGSASIWSLQAVDENKERQPVMTIAVDIRSKAVTQVRGRYNIAPVGKAKSVKQQNLSRAYIRLLSRSQRILKRWMTQEGLSLRC
jgi:hypothetical protein